MKQLVYFPNMYPPAGESSAADAIDKSIAWVAATLRRWHQRSEQRRQLAGLSIQQLDDIGITEAERMVETSKPFWRA
jgi:uncharacterized protein YjiS (DUF1127 family)